MEGKTTGLADKYHGWQYNFARRLSAIVTICTIRAGQTGGVTGVI